MSIRYSRSRSPSLSRRDFLRRGVGGAGALGVGLLGQPTLVPPARAPHRGADSFGELEPADANGLMLPPGFRSRVVATSGQNVASTGHTWHLSPDGGATYANGSGWIYVSNSERGGSNGGVGALCFDAAGNITDAYSILSGTSINCAGGPTPWGTWISCEEFNGGRAFECDPFNASQGSARAGLGTFKHEAAAVDPVHEHVYLTEDTSNGLLYRSTHPAWPNLDTGTLEAAEILDPPNQGPIEPGQVRRLIWHAIAEANPSGGGVQISSHLPIEERATRYQAPNATPFKGGEGCWYERGVVYFSTKRDNRVWALNTNANTVEIIYELATSSDPELSNVDNVYASPSGDVYVAEDPGNLEIVALTPRGDVKPIVRVTGISGTEITGPALSPDGSRLYFSSQRNPGQTFEVTGPFFGTVPPPFVDGWGAVLFAGALGAFDGFAARRDAAKTA